MANMTCLRCKRVLVDSDELGWYYQTPVTDPEMSGFVFMDRVHECEGKPHALNPATEEHQPDQLAAFVREIAALGDYEDSADILDAMPALIRKARSLAGQ